MSQQPPKKSGTLSLNKARAQTPDSGDKSDDRPGNTAAARPHRQKTGARAHHHKRIQTEQRRTQAAPVAPQAPDRVQRSQPSARAPKPAHRIAAVNHAPAADEIFQIFAPCPKGLEQALANELTALRFSDIKAAQAGCHFTGNWHDVWRANLYSRLATRILVRLSHGNIGNEDDLRALALATPWERWFGAEQTLRVDTSAIRSPMQSLQYCNLLVKDSICDRLRDREGARPSIDTVRPDARVHSFLSADQATLYLDTSGESLFKRGWRFDKTEAPIRENLAAGLLALSGWQSHEPLLDPFCGSGTILIEAAWQALGIAPGINRPFAFERLRAHDSDAWQDLRRQATLSVKNELAAPIVGCDLSHNAINAARSNLQRAGLRPDLIEWQIADATSFMPPTDHGVIVTNPPYGERLEIDDDLMSRWASHLKQNFAGWRVNIISADLELAGALRLKPKRRTPLYNGALECRLFLFDMVSKQYDPKRREKQAAD